MEDNTKKWRYLKVIWDISNLTSDTMPRRKDTYITDIIPNGNYLRSNADIPNLPEAKDWEVLT